MEKINVLIQAYFWPAFLAVLIGIFKSQLGDAIKAFSVLSRRGSNIGSVVELLGPDGSWCPVRIIGMYFPFPFKKKRGVHVITESDDKKRLYFTLSNWNDLALNGHIRYN